MPERPIQSFIVQLLRAQIQTNARKRACQIISLTHFLTIRPSGMSTAPLSSTRGSAPAATAASSISDRSNFCRIGRTNMISLIPRQHSAAPAIIHDVTGKRCTSIAAASCFRIRDDIWVFVRDAGRRARRTDEGDRSPLPSRKRRDEHSGNCHSKRKTAFCGYASLSRTRTRTTQTQEKSQVHTARVVAAQRARELALTAVSTSAAHHHCSTAAPIATRLARRRIAAQTSYNNSPREESKQ